MNGASGSTAKSRGGIPGLVVSRWPLRPAFVYYLVTTPATGVVVF